MSDSNDLLPEDLLWATGGHASDVVLTALADGQTAIVPPAVRAHVERCTICTTHLGHAGLLSLYTGEELALKAKYELEFTKERRPLPRVAIALGLFVAVLGALPSVVDAPSSGLRTLVTRDLPLVARGFGALLGRVGDPGGTVSLFVTYATAALLVAAGFAVIRLLPRKETSR